MAKLINQYTRKGFRAEILRDTEGYIVRLYDGKAELARMEQEFCHYASAANYAQDSLADLSGEAAIREANRGFRSMSMAFS